MPGKKFESSCVNKSQWNCIQVKCLNVATVFENIDEFIIKCFRCDSMGFCAQFGSYTLMDLASNKILDMQAVTVSDRKQQNAIT